MATTKKAGRGRPQKYPLTTNQIKSISTRLNRGEKPSSIVEALGVHPFAVLRVKRGLIS